MTEASGEPAESANVPVNESANKPMRQSQAPKRDADQISAIMRRVHGRDTTPEVRLRQALSAHGLHANAATDAADSLPGKPDIVFGDARLAVFVDGDYWHGNQWRRRGKAALEEQFEASAAEARAY
jgi:DNA mismatch endonuclease Vsr